TSAVTAVIAVGTDIVIVRRSTTVPFKFTVALELLSALDVAVTVQVAFAADRSRIRVIRTVSYTAAVHRVETDIHDNFDFSDKQQYCRDDEEQRNQTCNNTNYQWCRQYTCKQHQES